jgi:hypothetical protein
MDRETTHQINCGMAELRSRDAYLSKTSSDQISFIIVIFCECPFTQEVPTVFIDRWYHRCTGSPQDEDEKQD